MDEAREEREELAALEREDAEDAREQEAARHFWTDGDGLEWAELVTLETERWSRGSH